MFLLCAMFLVGQESLVQPFFAVRVVSFESSGFSANSSPASFASIEPRSSSSEKRRIFSGHEFWCFDGFFPFCSIKIRQEVVLVMQAVDILADDRMISYLQKSVEAVLFKCKCNCCSDVLEADCSNCTAHNSYTSHFSWTEVATDHVN